MPHILSQNPTMGVLTILAFVVGAALALLPRKAAGPQAGPEQAILVRFGIASLLFLCLGLFPLNVANHLLAERFAWIFGSETFDGGLVETLTVAFYASAIMAIGVLLARRSGAATTLIWRTILILAIPTLIFLIGEEMSWGQHMLGFATPEGLLEANLQKEANVHNLVSPRFYDALYQVIGFVLILAPAASLSPRLMKLLGPLGSGARLAFTWPGLYPLFALTGFLLQHEVFEELAELSLAVTLFYFFAAFDAVERSSGIASRQAIMTNSAHSPS
jgi:hypothetical protein